MAVNKTAGVKKVKLGSSTRKVAAKKKTAPKKAAAMKKGASTRTAAMKKAASTRTAVLKKAVPKKTGAVQKAKPAQEGGHQEGHGAEADGDRSMSCSRGSSHTRVPWVTIPPTSPSTGSSKPCSSTRSSRRAPSTPRRIISTTRFLRSVKSTWSQVRCARAESRSNRSTQMRAVALTRGQGAEIQASELLTIA